MNFKKILTYIVKRILTLIVLLIAISFVTFVATRLAPGDPALMVMPTSSSPEAIAAFHKEFGLDDPIYLQYYRFLKNFVLYGDLGRSYITRGPVILRIKDSLPATIQLAVAGVIVSTIIGGFTGIISAVKKGTKVDSLARAFSIFGVSTPIFLSGPIFIIIFSVQLRLLPTSGGGGIEHLILPALCLGLFSAAEITRVVRATMLQILNRNYIMTARAKGLSEKVVIYKHALRNALIPFVTIFGLQFGMLMAGAIITETVFAWPGVGRLMINSILMRDAPTVNGCLLFFASAFLLINFIVEISYAFIDPRIRGGKR
jgi:peptide/nickel transport system permease protein